MKYKYQKLVGQLVKQIEQGTYAPGQKLPGIRKLSNVSDTSISTVITAYQTLEQMGYVEAKPRSGYVVKNKKQLPATDKLSFKGISAPTLVKTQEVALELAGRASVDGIVKFGEAIPASQYFPFHDIQRAIKRVAKTYGQSAIKYEKTLGSEQLRTIISRRMADHGTFVSPDDILITNGTQEAVMLSLRLVTSPGDVIAVESPTFYGLLQIIYSLGLKVIEIPTYPKTGMCLKSLKHALQKWKVKACLCIPNFSNPSGTLMPDIQKMELISLLQSHQVPLIEDDNYGDLTFSERRPSSCLGLSNGSDIFYCGGFSKTISPDLRIGWVTNPLYTKQLAYHKFVTNLSTSAFPQLVIADVLSNGHYDRHLRRIRSEYKDCLEKMLHAVERYFPDNTRIVKPDGGFMVWAELPVQIDTMQLLADVIKNGISIAPGVAFSASGKYTNFIRLSYACNWNSATERALEYIGNAAKNLLIEPARAFGNNN
ncbi:PLP-dependent aminotransferase family protein [Neptunicella sp. SCSIO 80796]|uniref:aminotransferase-like domain-containing protein n=1 Tax=Neptunicella plasticusilytica TaxID=3117012 RepID=UPI003A4D9A9D